MYCGSSWCCFGSTMLGFNDTMLALMIALYLEQDSFGTATNVTGDGAFALIVNRFSRDKTTKRNTLKS